MAELTVGESALGTALTRLLMCDDINAGSEPNYSLCKEIYLNHPLGAKMADGPIALVQSQKRKLSVPGCPETMLIDAFDAEWEKFGANGIIANGGGQARVYGKAALVALSNSDDDREPLNFAKLAKQDIFINVLDPLNTAGSGPFSQDPNSVMFQRQTMIQAAGRLIHPSRACVIQNEHPIYLSYTSSTFSYSGRSVYQRPLFALKTFIQSMRTDDLIQRKAGVLISKTASRGSAVDKITNAVKAFQRAIVKMARSDDVLSIGHEDSIESLDLTHIPEAAGYARKNSLENCAMAADMPAKVLNQETFAEGFGEGTEDAKNVARWVNRVRNWIDPVYVWMDKIIMYRAWTPSLYEAIQAEYPDQYANIPYETAFVEFCNKFKAEWPNLLVEPDSEKVKVEDVKFKASVAIVEVLMPELDPDNKAALVEWFASNINECQMLFPNPLLLDLQRFAEYQTERAAQAPQIEGDQEPKLPVPFSSEA